MCSGKEKLVIVVMSTTTDFWKDVSKIYQTYNVISSSIDGISNECNISVFWKDHFGSFVQ